MQTDFQLEQAIDDLMGLINSPSQPPSSSMQHAASRHRDNLDDYRRDFLRTRVSLPRPSGRWFEQSGCWTGYPAL